MLAFPFLQQLLPSAFVQVLEQPSDFASALLQHALVVVLPVATFSVLAFAAVVTFCADTVVMLNAKIRVIIEITSATFFIVISFF